MSLVLRCTISLTCILSVICLIICFYLFPFSIGKCGLPFNVPKELFHSTNFNALPKKDSMKDKNYAKKLILVIYGDVFYTTRGEPTGIAVHAINMIEALQKVIKPPDKLVFLQIPFSPGEKPGILIEELKQRQRKLFDRQLTNENYFIDPLVENVENQMGEKPTKDQLERDIRLRPIKTITIEAWQREETILKLNGIENNEKQNVVVLIQSGILRRPMTLLQSNLCIGVFTHDTIAEEKPTPPYLMKVRSEEIPKRANFFITVSATSRQKISQLFNIPLQYIGLAYDSIDSAFKIPPTSLEIEQFSQKFNLHKPYFIFTNNRISGYAHIPGSDHKNGLNMWRAINILPPEILDNVIFVLVFQDLQSSEKKIIREGVTIKYVGKLSTRELRAAYGGTLALLMVSEMEGFGLGALECMACNCVVVSSTTYAMPEIVGEAGYYANPYDPKEISEQIELVYRNKTLREERKRIGYMIAHNAEFGIDTTTRNSNVSSDGWTRSAKNVTEFVKYGSKRWNHCGI